MLPLNPKLVLTGRVPGILATLKHRNHYDLDVNWFGGWRSLRKKHYGKNPKNSPNQNEPLREPCHEIPQLLIGLLGLLCCA
jgi:hypothetical protein